MTITEWCPNCENENEYNINDEMYVKCKTCDEIILLCSVCNKGYDNCKECEHKNKGD